MSFAGRAQDVKECTPHHVTKFITIRIINVTIINLSLLTPITTERCQHRCRQLQRQGTAAGAVPG